MSIRFEEDPKPIPDKHPDSIYGVICENCGSQGLTKENYIIQMMNPDALWKCPICLHSAPWDDDRYENGLDSF